MRDELFINSQTSTAHPLKFENGYVISSHALLIMSYPLYLSMAGLKIDLF